MNLRQKTKKPHIGITAQPLLAELLREQAELAKPKTYPIKQFLLSRSYLVKYNEKEAIGKELSRLEKSKKTRIYELRDRVFGLIKYHLERYYNKAIKGNYYYDSLTQEYNREIKTWIENKIWKLLVGIGEPNHGRFKKTPADYWEEA